MQGAHRSRLRMNSARGRLSSGPTVRWEREWDADMTMALELAPQMPNRSASHSTASHEELEQGVVDVHQLAGRVASLTEKYKRSLAEDEVHGAELRRHPRPASSD